MKMPRLCVSFLCAVVAIGSTLAIGPLAQSAQDHRNPPEKDWPVVGGDWGNTRYTPLTQINATNVKSLKGASMARLNSGFGAGFSQQATPVIRDGVLYITTGEQDVFALDASRGTSSGQYRSPWDRRTPDNKAKRGVGIGGGMVFGVEVDIRPQAPVRSRQRRSRWTCRG